MARLQEELEQHRPSPTAQGSISPPEASALSAKQRLSVAVACGFLALAALLFVGIHGTDEASSTIETLWTRLQAMPAWLFFPAMAVICVMPVPISPFYLAAGPLFGVATSLAWIAPALVFNQLLAYTLARGLLRPLIESVLARRGFAIPVIRATTDQNLFTFLLRAVPAVPYALQNWILGLAGIERARYLAISWPVQMLYATAWVTAGESAFEGRYGTLLSAIAAILAFAFFGRWIGIRMRNRNPAPELPLGPER